MERCSQALLCAREEGPRLATRRVETRARKWAVLYPHTRKELFERKTTPRATPPEDAANLTQIDGLRCDDQNFLAEGAVVGE